MSQEELTFEQTLAELETVVEKLQSPDLPLDQAVALYKRGTELASRAEELLNRAELQVQQLNQAVREQFVEYSTEEAEEAN